MKTTLKAAICLSIVLSFVSVTAIAGTNFQPKNQSENPHLVPEVKKKRNPISFKNSEFWNKEYERSGFSEFGDKFSVNVFEDIGNFFKQQRENYIERNKNKQS